MKWPASALVAVLCFSILTALTFTNVGIANASAPRAVALSFLGFDFHIPNLFDIPQSISDFITGAPAADSTALACTLTASPTTIDAGGSATLTWSLKNFDAYASKNFFPEVSGTAAGAATKTINLDCSSLGYKYTECPLGVAIDHVVSIHMVRQYSYCSKQCPTDSKPMEGTNYGVKNGNVFWVDHGYRANFDVTYVPASSVKNASGTTVVHPPVTTTYTLTALRGPATQPAQQTLERDCSSLGYKYQECPLGVAIQSVVSIGIVKQYSYCSKECPTDSTPMEGTNYGIKNGNVLWTAHGYRARFLVTYIPAVDSAHVECSATVVVNGSDKNTITCNKPPICSGKNVVNACTGETLQACTTSCVDAVADATDPALKVAHCAPGVCTPGLMCGGTNLNYQNADCSQSFRQACVYGCSSGACIPTPVDTSNKKPIVTLIGQPPLVQKGGECTLSLSAQFVTSCRLEGKGIDVTIPGDKMGSIATSTTHTPALQNTETYTLTCQGSQPVVKSVDCKIAPTFKEI